MENKLHDIMESNIEHSSNLKLNECSSSPLDFKQELAHCSEMNGRLEEINKMFVCQLCDFRTAFRNSLLNHQAVHSDLRPWVCSMCDYAAKRKQDLKKHLHTIHGVMVESTMLKPVGVNPTVNCPPVKPLSREESSEDNNSCDNDKVMKSINIVDQSASFPHIGHESKPVVSVKRELQEQTDPPSCSVNLPGMSNFVRRNSMDSSDLDLPLSFPTVSFSKTTANSHSDFQKSVSSGEEYSFPFEQFPSNSKEKQYIESFSPSQGQKSNRKRTYASLQEVQDTGFHTDRHSQLAIKSHDIDEHHPCSSSSASCTSHIRETQTHATFVCEHCDIMFFQRAMYLMHIGLHSPDDPWCCAVCGNTFTEKYSFTSHFINQH